MSKKLCCIFLAVVMLLPMSHVSAENVAAIGNTRGIFVDEDDLLSHDKALIEEPVEFPIPSDEESLQYCENGFDDIATEDLLGERPDADVMMLPFTSSIQEGIKSFQQYINTNLPMSYLGKALKTSGSINDATKTAAVKLIQYRLNQAGASLAVDGAFGPASQAAFTQYVGTIERYSSGVWVYILQGLLYCHLYDPNGFDGSYGVNGGTGCLNAVNLFKKRNLITEGGSGTVGINTMLCLTWRTVENTFDNGIYYIYSMLGNCLHVSNGGIDDYTRVNMFARYAAGTDEVMTLRQLWKITYLGQGYYSIRPMNKLDMALTVSGSNAVIRYAGESDAFNTLANQFKWTVTENDLGIVLRNYNDSSKLLCVENDSTSSGAYVCLGESTSSKQKWNFVKVENPPSGFFLYDTASGRRVITATRYMSLNQIKRISNFDLVTVRYSADTNSQALLWTTSDESQGPLGWSNNIQIKTYIPTVEIIRGTDLGGKYVQITIIVSDIEEGGYRIRNVNNGKYADILNQNLSEGTNIHQWDRHSGESQLWNFRINSRDGYYYIMNAKGGEVYCLGVQNNSTSENAQIVLAVPNGTDGTKWKVNGSAHGSYVLRPKTGGSDKVLVMDFAGSANGIPLKQKTYTNDTNYIDEWYLERPGGTFGVVSYFDAGFEERFTDDFGWAEYKIAKVQNIVSQKFKLFFELNVVPMYIPYRSKADDCKISTYGYVQSDNISKACAHTVNCLTWDKQCFKIQSAYGNGTNRIAKVLWTGHIMENNATSVSRPSANMAMITPTNTFAHGVPTSGDLLEQYQFGDFMHELSHLLGTNDHYCYGKPSEQNSCANPYCDACNGRSTRKCIMQEYEIGMKDEFTSSGIYCSDCIQNIQNHINNHHK